MKNTNCKSYTDPLHRYLLEAISSEDKELKTPQEKLNHFFACFGAEYNDVHTRRRYPSTQGRLAQYLRGLPSCIEIAYTYYDIGKLAEELHGCWLSESQKERICGLYWDHVALHLLKLQNKLAPGYFSQS